MIYTNDFENKILYEPALLDGEMCTRLRIITGFTDCDMIAQHLLNLYAGQKTGNRIYAKGIHIDIILGMYKGNGLTKRKHKKIMQTLSRINSIKRNSIQTTCRYVYTGPEVHSKIYVWCRNEEPVIGFAGSANYTMNAFRVRREAMTDCSANDALAYYRFLYKDTIDCFDKQVSEHLHFLDKAGSDEEISPYNFENLSYDKLIEKEPIDILKVSWLRSDGNVGQTSGPNWGFRRDRKYNRNHNESYIPYNVRQHKEGFFPDRIHPDDKNCPLFKAVTKDSGIFYMRMAQEKNKALESAESNTLLGKWLRNKLGLPEGAEVRKADFDRYGSSVVTFRKYSDDVFTMDF